MNYRRILELRRALINLNNGNENIAEANIMTLILEYEQPLQHDSEEIFYLDCLHCSNLLRLSLSEIENWQIEVCRDFNWSVFRCTNEDCFSEQRFCSGCRLEWNVIICLECEDIAINITENEPSESSSTSSSSQTLSVTTDSL